MIQHKLVRNEEGESNTNENTECLGHTSWSKKSENSRLWAALTSSLKSIVEASETIERERERERESNGDLEE